MSTFELNETRYGFDWGPMTVERVASDPKWGVVVLVKPSGGDYDDAVYVRVSPKGRSITVQGYTPARVTP